MQRTYRERKYICGDYIEVEIYPVYTQTKGRGKRKKPTTEIQKRLNKRHATDRLRRLLHTNFTPQDLFVTLTFDDECLVIGKSNTCRFLSGLFPHGIARIFENRQVSCKYALPRMKKGARQELYDLPFRKILGRSKSKKAVILAYDK